MDTEILKQLFELEKRIKILEDDRELSIYDQETGFDIRVLPCELAQQLWDHVRKEKKKKKWK